METCFQDDTRNSNFDNLVISGTTYSSLRLQTQKLNNLDSMKSVVVATTNSGCLLQIVAGTEQHRAAFASNTSPTSAPTDFNRTDVEPGNSTFSTPAGNGKKT